MEGEVSTYCEDICCVLLRLPEASLEVYSDNKPHGTGISRAEGGVGLAVGHSPPVHSPVELSLESFFG